jgi:hypothetical protein
VGTVADAADVAGAADAATDGVDAAAARAAQIATAVLKTAVPSRRMLRMLLFIVCLRDDAVHIRVAARLRRSDHSSEACGKPLHAPRKV